MSKIVNPCQGKNIVVGYDLCLECVNYVFADEWYNFQIPAIVLFWIYKLHTLHFTTLQYIHKHSNLTSL